MIRSTFNQIFILTIICTICYSSQKDNVFNVKPWDDIIQTHFDFLTRYEHSFNHIQEGDCGILFDIAVQQLKSHEDFLNMLPLVKEKLKSSNFDRKKCKHVSSGYTWVLLVLQDANMTCEVHLPLDLRNLDKDDNETYPIFNKKYAERAIKDKSSWCYTVDEKSGQKHEKLSEINTVLYPNKYQEMKYNSDSGNEFHDINYKNVNHLTVPFKTTKSDSSDNNVEDIALYNRRTDKKGVNLLKLDKCTKEDKLRILELYAAEIIKDKAVGYQIYTENISDCKVNHDNVDTYIAKIHLNHVVCEFHAINDTKNVGLIFMPPSDENIISCQNFKGLF